VGITAAKRMVAALATISRGVATLGFRAGFEFMLAASV